MKAVVQRVEKAEVYIEDKKTASIGKGLVVLLGVTHSDTEKEAGYLAEKIAGLRVFEDTNGKMNLSGLEVAAQFLVVSQFTLYGDCSKGRRPSFTMAARAFTAEKLYNCFVEKLRSYGPSVLTGEFQAKMVVSLENDGPVTLIVES